MCTRLVQKVSTSLEKNTDNFFNKIYFYKQEDILNYLPKYFPPVFRHLS